MTRALPLALAAVALAATLVPGGGDLRAPAVLPFLVLAPGLSLIGLVRPATRLAQLVLGVALSLALDLLVAQAMLAAGWHPAAAVVALAGICVGGVAVQAMAERGRARRAVYIAGVLGAGAALSLAGPTRAVRACQAVRAASAGCRVLWGAYAGGAQYGRADAPWDMGSARALEAQVAKRMTLLEWGQDWYECNSGDPRRCGMTRFPAGLAARVRAHGALPVLSWGSYAGGRGSEQPAYRLAEIIAGRYDRSILAWARAAAAWRHPFFLRFDWEMNTNEVPYSEHANGNRAGEFVRMWRHVHALFVRAGATNAIWVWCPNVEYPGSVMPLRALYPGNRYVDWVGLDGYNWGTDRGRWQTPAEVFGATYDRLTRRIAPSKPVMIGETASSEHGGSKAHWIADLVRRQLPRRFPRVRAVVWFNKSADGIDWPISTSAAAVRAFRRAIASPRYAGRRLR